MTKNFFILQTNFNLKKLCLNSLAIAFSMYKALYLFIYFFVW